MFYQIRCEPRFRISIRIKSLGHSGVSSSCMIFIFWAIFILSSSFELLWHFFYSFSPKQRWIKIRISHISCSSKFIVIAQYLSKQSILFTYFILRNWIRFTVRMLQRRIEQSKHYGATFCFRTQHIFIIGKKKYNFGIFAAAFSCVFWLCRRFQWKNWRSRACIACSIIGGAVYKRICQWYLLIYHFVSDIR